MALTPLPDLRALAQVFDALEDQARNGGLTVESIRDARRKALSLASNASPQEQRGATPAGPDYRVLFERLPGLYLILDPALRIVAASDAYLDATKTRDAGIIGRYLFDVFPDNPDDPSADSIRNTRASLTRVIQTRRPDEMVVQRHDIRRPASEGGGFEVRFWSPINSPVLNPDGSLAYIVHRVEDVTEFVLLKQKGAEQARASDALRERTMRMEADLYARSREVANASLKLKEANEELARLYEKSRELDALKSTLFANVSHELRTPLTLILGPVRRLQSAPNLDDAQRHALSVIERNAGTLLKNVNNLLDLSKLDAGRLQMDYAETDVAKLARFVAAHFESVADEHRIRFTVDLPGTLPGEVDSEKLQRILFNVLSNAFKFTPADGAVRVELRGDSGTARFRVEDTGPGVPADMRETIFERFRQGDSGPSRHDGGTGLGLAIVKEFVLLHHGRVGVENGGERGAVFTIEIPLKAPPGSTVSRPAPVRQEESNRALVAELQSHPQPATHSGNRAPADAALVLVMEDNAEMRSFLTESLQPHFRVVSAPDGEAGLQRALELQPDVIITDVMMPRKSGEDVIRALRKNPRFDATPVLLLTAKADDRLRAEWLRMGAQDCLLKPFNGEELVARVSGLTAHKRMAERMLETERELLTKIIDAIPVMITIFDPAQRTFRFNQELRQVLGWTEADAADGDFMAKVYPDPEYRKQVAEFMQSLEPGWRDFEVTAKDGTKVLSTWANVSLANDVSVGIGVDIRERKAAEEALRESQKLLASTMENFPTAIVFKDHQGRFIDVNPPVEKAIGLPKSRVVGATDHDFFPREWADQTRAYDLEVMRTREPRQREIITPAPTGDICHLDTGFPLIDANGAVYGVGHISHDITAVKHAEAALREREAQLRALNETLEQRVQERTKLLHEANTNLQAFANSAAHDLRSPLRTISGFSELIAEEYHDRLDDAARSYLRRIGRAAEHMGRLLTDLLEYSRLGQADLKLETVRLDETVRETVAMLEAAISEKRAEVVVEAPLPPVRGHAATVTVVLNNLVTNALKFTRPDVRPRVRIRGEETGSHVRLWVEDNGIGIAPEDIPKLFGPFQRLHPKDVYPGTGLGLALVRRAAERMGGAAGVESEVGEGSRFWIELPKP